MIGITVSPHAGIDGYWLHETHRAGACTHVRVVAAKDGGTVSGYLGPLIETGRMRSLPGIRDRHK